MLGSRAIQEAIGSQIIQKTSQWRENTGDYNQDNLNKMNRFKIFIKNFFDLFYDFLNEPLTTYSLIIGLSVSSFLVMESVYPRFSELVSAMGFRWLEDRYPVFTTVDDRQFSINFVEWFGVFYGFFLPTLLIRTWDLFDNADREFDREADSIKVLHEDILLLDDDHFLPFKTEMVIKLHSYARHVLRSYKIEHEDINEHLRSRGNNILQGIRVGYKELIYRGGGKQASQLEPVTAELLNRLNDTIDTRGDRIAIFKQRLYESLRFVAVFTSVLWLIPFYFLNYESGIFGSFLKLSVTFLIIFVLTIIDDLDKPFTGFFKMNLLSWKQIYTETNSSYFNLRERVTKPSTKRSSKKTRATKSRAGSSKPKAKSRWPIKARKR